MNNAEKIEDVLNSLDGVKRAEARPFMYTRIQARLRREESNIWARIGSLITRPAIACACLVTVLTANIYYIVNSENGDLASPTATIEVTSDIQPDSFVLAMNNMDNNLDVVNQ